jgi:hypothetical protein
MRIRLSALVADAAAICGSAILSSRSWRRTGQTQRLQAANRYYRKATRSSRLLSTQTVRLPPSILLDS